MMFFSLPPAGMRFRAREVVAALSSLLRDAASVRRSFEEALRDWQGAAHVFTLSSGRAGLTLILRALRAFSARDEVVVPGYTCPTIPLSVARAGLHARICDIEEGHLTIDSNQLSRVVGPRTLAVVVPHMFGFPCDMGPILGAVRRQGAYVIEDCSQSVGALYRGRRVGSWGDAAFFSLGRSKGMSTYRGGVIVTDAPDLAEQIADQIGALGPSGRAREAVAAAEVLMAYLTYSARVWWLAARIPGVRDDEEYRLDFEIRSLEACRAALGTCVLERLDEVNAWRRQRGSTLRRMLLGAGCLSIPEALPEAVPTYTWFPVVAKSPALRWKLYHLWNGLGLGVSTMYRGALTEYDYLKEIVAPDPIPVAERIAERLLTLPTHELVDIHHMVEMKRAAASIEGAFPSGSPSVRRPVSRERGRAREVALGSHKGEAISS
jgi:perosamine synthetase